MSGRSTTVALVAENLFEGVGLTVVSGSSRGPWSSELNCARSQSSSRPSPSVSVMRNTAKDQFQFGHGAGIERLLIGDLDLPHPATGFEEMVDGIVGPVGWSEAGVIVDPLQYAAGAAGRNQGDAEVAPSSVRGGDTQADMLADHRVCGQVHEGVPGRNG